MSSTSVGGGAIGIVVVEVDVVEDVVDVVVVVAAGFVVVGEVLLPEQAPVPRTRTIEAIRAEGRFTSSPPSATQFGTLTDHAPQS